MFRVPETLSRIVGKVADVLLAVPANVERYDYRMNLSMIIANYIAQPHGVKRPAGGYSPL